MVTIGQKLHDLRVKKGLSIDDVERAIKIKAVFISSIEKGEYHKLPSAYVSGFVSNYIDFLNLPKRESLARFRREYDPKGEYHVLPEGLSSNNAFSLRGFRLSPKVLVFLCFFVILIGFLTYQLRFSFINPPLAVFEPRDGDTVERVVTVRGKTDVNASLTINNDAVVIEKNGEFTEKVSLFPGNSVLVIRATNRLGKQTVIERTINVE